MSVIEQKLPVILLFVLHKVVPTFESAYEILKCDHSNDSYWVVLSCGAVNYASQNDSNFLVCESNLQVKCDHSDESCGAVLPSGAVCLSFFLFFAILR